MDIHDSPRRSCLSDESNRIGCRNEKISSDPKRKQVEAENRMRLTAPNEMKTILIEEKGQQS